MRLIVVAGWKSRDIRSNPEQIYWGISDLEAAKAAREAQASGKYANGCIKEKKITDWIPRPAVPQEPPPATMKPAQPLQPNMKKTSKVSALTTAAAVLGLILISAQTTFGQLASGSAGSTAPAYGANVVSGIPPSINQATLVTLTNGPVIDCRFFQNLALIFAFNNLANETTPGAVRLTFARSLDRVGFETTNKITWDVISAGTNTSRVATNINVGGVGFLQLQSVSNSVASGTYMTNIVLQYSNKRAAP